MCTVYVFIYLFIGVDVFVRVMIIKDLISALRSIRDLFSL